MIVEEPEHLTGWLTKELGPICDADPSSLAKYVIALIRKPDKTDEQLKDFCLEQLDAFLQSSTQRFVDRLFVTLKDKCYVPQSKTRNTTPTLEVKKEAPVERERERMDKDDRDKKGKENDTAKKEVPPPRTDKELSPRANRSRASNAPLLGANEKQKESPRREVREIREVKREEVITQRMVRKRISPPPVDRIPEKDRRRRSRSPRDRRGVVGGSGRRRSAERHRDTRKRSRSRSGERHEHRRDVDKKRKQRCRDFDEKGYCMSGDQCQFDHGPDPVVVDDHALEKMVKMPKGNSAPTAPNFSLPPPGYNPIATQPPPPGIAVADAGYNPEAPALSSGPNFSVPPPPIMGMSQAPTWRPPPQQPFVGTMAVQQYDPSVAGPNPSVNHEGPGPMRGMRGRGRGRGVRGGRAPYGGHSQRDNSGKSLEVRKIPPEFNNISKLNEHFAKFGSIVNLQVHYEGDPEAALVTFSSRGEANNAYKSTEPILNNRFIKVFWHQPVAAGEIKTTVAVGGSHQRTVLNSGVTVERPTQAQEMVPLPVAHKEPIILPSKEQTIFRNPLVEEKQKKKAESMELRRKEKQQQKQWLALHRAKSDLIDKLLAQQKTAFSIARKAEAGGDAEQKKKAVKMIGLLKKKVDTTKEEVRELYNKLVELRNSQQEAAAELAAKGEDPARDTPSPNIDEQASDEVQEGVVESREEKTTVIVRGFNADKLNEVTDLLAQCGEVSTSTIFDEGDNGSCLLSFAKTKAAEKAVSLDGSLHLDGRSLSISFPVEGEKSDED